LCIKNRVDFLLISPPFVKDVKKNFFLTACKKYSGASEGVFLLFD